jgi:hypothetical protein
VRTVLAFFLVLVLAPQVRAEPSADAKAAIVSIISRQIDAFRRDDGAEAFGYASPNIQAKFGTPAGFMRMVIEGYFPVYRPKSVKFLDLAWHDGLLIQHVLIEGPDGAFYLALYPMAQMPDGTWRVDGCYLLHAPSQGV